MNVNTNKIIVGIVLLSASIVLSNILFRESSQKEKIIAGALIGAANGAYIGGAFTLPGGAVAGAAVGAAIGGIVGEKYDKKK